MQKLITKIAIAGTLLAPLALAMPAMAAAPNWDATGSYVVAFDYLGTDYAHDMTLAQDGLGALTGGGGYLAGAVHTYEWAINSGAVDGDSIHLETSYTLGAVCDMTIDGSIASDGTMSGTWTDNYAGGSRGGTWTTTSGTAVLLGTLSAEDFGVVNYDTGLGILAGYTAGFGVSDATLAGATSVVVQLYSGATLLQTNTAILAKFNADITGTQFSSPFDVSGTFDYATDGYWTNVRQAEYGQSVPATRVVATVTLVSGKVVTAENTTLVGDPTTIFPAPVCEAPAAPAIANAFLREAGVKSSSTEGKNIISQVAHEMNAGGFGENPCAPGYAEAVEEFVNPLLPS